MANFLQDSVFKKYLYNFTVGQYNEQDNMTGPFISPIVQTPTIAGNYMKYSSLDAFTVTDTVRQPGQAATVVSPKGTPVAFNMTPNALDYPIDQALLDMSDQETAGIHYQTLAKYLVSQAHTNLESVTWANISGSATLNTSYGTNWSNASGSTSNVVPFAEIEKAYYNIATSIGAPPNRMVVGTDAWRYLKFAYASRGNFPANMVNDAMIKDYLSGVGNGIEVKVGFIGGASNRGQTTRTITPFVDPAEVWLFYADANPNLMDRSAFKTLQYGQGIQNLRSYTSTDQRTTFMAVDWYVDAGKVTNPYGYIRFRVS